MENLVIKQNTDRIEAEQAREAKFATYFQPLVNALAKNTFSAPLDMGVIIDLVYNGNIGFLTTEAIAKNPVLVHLPINQDSKNSMVDLPATYPNYKEIMAAYNEARSKGPHIKAKIYNFDLDDNMQLVLSDAMKTSITNAHTVFARDKAQFEHLKQLNKILADIKEFHAQTGVNLFHPALTSKGGIGTGLESCQINIDGFVFHYQPAAKVAA